MEKCVPLVPGLSMTRTAGTRLKMLLGACSACLAGFVCVWPSASARSPHMPSRTPQCHITQTFPRSRVNIRQAPSQSYIHPAQPAAHAVSPAMCAAASRGSFTQAPSPSRAGPDSRLDQAACRWHGPALRGPLHHLCQRKQ